MNKSKITQLTIATAASSVFVSSLFSAIATAKTTASQDSRAANNALIAQALAPEEVNLRAKQIIVRIDGASVGSGSIIEHNGDRYKVLTNWHVMKNEGGYVVQTIDGRKHEVIPDSIQQLGGLDLAVFEFTSSQNYQTAELGNSGNVNEGQIIYFAGYPGELRREDNRYYRFFTANMVGILPKATENGYSLIYSGEAFPGMSGGPVFNRDGLVIGVHGEANVHALSGGTSNYAIPIASYQQAITQQAAAENNSTPNTPQPQPEPATPEPPEVSEVPEIIIEEFPQPQPEPEPEPVATTPAEAEGSSPEAESNTPAEAEIVSVPTFTPPQQPEPEPEPEASAPPKAQSEKKSAESEASNKPTARPKVTLVSAKTGIDYTKLRNLLQEGKWSEADLHTYRLVEQIFKSAKLKNKRTFIELKTIAEYSCSDMRTIDYLWQKYSNNQFGFSQQQSVWQNVNQAGDFSAQTWRRFATEVGWKKGEVDSSSGYLLYNQLDFEPENAPAGHLPWWFAMADEEQQIIKSLFSRCNLNPSPAELAAEAQQNSADTAQNPNNRNRTGENRARENGDSSENPTVDEQP